ncbi:MAG: tetratricopeptide repeat protein [Rikenellaceae bacterium]
MRKFIFIFIVLLSALSPKLAQAQYNKAYFYYRGRGYLVEDNYIEAIKTLNILLKVDPNAHEGYFLRGIAKYNLDDLLGAEIDFSEAIDRNPVFTTAYQYRAITRARLANYSDAIEDFKHAIELRPDINSTYYSRSVAYLMSGDNNKALEDLNTFISKEKGVVDAYINRGTTHLNLSDTTSALQDFNWAIKLNKENPNSYNRRGSLYLAQSKYALALDDFNNAISLDSTNIQSYFNRALTYSNTKRPDAAIQDFGQVIKMDSTSAIAYFNRAIVKTGVGDYNSAINDYNKVIEILPDNVLVYFNRSLVHQRLGNLKLAINDCTRAIELYPDFANAYNQRALVKYQNGDIKGAEKDKKIADAKIKVLQEKKEKDPSGIYSDTTHNFMRLISFDSKTGGSDMFRLRSSGVNVALLPSFRFSIIEQKNTPTTIDPTRYFLERVEGFKAQLNEHILDLSIKPCFIDADSLISINNQLKVSTSWQEYFIRSIAQFSIKQYTASITSLNRAIEAEPNNPFLYFNRSTVKSEMIDFISSIEDNIQNITINDNSQLKRSTTRTYNYDDAISDLNKVIFLYPEFAHAYYNRANLNAITGELTKAYDNYTKAIELNPSFAEAYYNRGLVQIYMKDTRKGCLDISKAAELGIENAYEVLKIYSK